MKSDQKGGWNEFTVRVVPGRVHLDSIYFGNLLIEALGAARDEGLGIGGFEIVRVEDFKFTARLLSSGTKSAEMVLRGTLEALRDSGHGLESFEIDGLALSAGEANVEQPNDPRDSWSDLK
ncbi:MAG: hypothetical protein JRN21_09335 [Nitrososphaerota archaeon]|nr:hypothetical protein [Nitrososphaerota archaeon]